MKLFRRILVPHDFSEHATRALEVAAQLARDHGGSLLVLHVIMPFTPITGLPGEAIAWVPEPDLAADQRRLETLVARTVRGRKAPRTACKVVIGDVFKRIIDAARGSDSIVMSTAGRTGLSHLVIGSIAEKVVRHSPVPVLTFRPPTGRARGRTRRRTGRTGKAAGRR